MKRVLIAVTVPDDVDADDLALTVPPTVGSDPTVWEWADWWADAADCLVTPSYDGSAEGDATQLSYLAREDAAA